MDATDPRDTREDATNTAADERQARADAALRAIAAGANPTVEAFQLANRFTDETIGSIAAALRRVFRRPQERPPG